MVEKLQGTELGTTSKHGHFSSKDEAMNKVVYDYLKHHGMYYTMSVFASECLSVHQTSNLDNLLVRKDILNTLGINNLPPTSRYLETNCLLSWIVETFGSFASKKSENRSSQYDLENNSKVLMLNTQSQTDAFQVPLFTQSAQTSPTAITYNSGTQTDSCSLSIHQASVELNNEILDLKKKLETSEVALKLCQSKLLDNEKKFECLLTSRNERFIAGDYSALARPDKCSVRDQSSCHKRVQEASRFLNHLEDRLSYLDQKYQNIVGTQTIHDNSRL